MRTQAATCSHTCTNTSSLIAAPTSSTCTCTNTPHTHMYTHLRPVGGTDQQHPPLSTVGVAALHLHQQLRLETAAGLVFALALARRQQRVDLVDEYDRRLQQARHRKQRPHLRRKWEGRGEGEMGGRWGVCMTWKRLAVRQAFSRQSVSCGVSELVIRKAWELAGVLHAPLWDTCRVCVGVTHIGYLWAHAGC